MKDEFDIDECCRRNKNAMQNTTTGKWLAAACREIESLRLQLAPKYKAHEKDEYCHRCIRVFYHKP